MRILGIETSCDETASSVVDNGKEILSNVVATSSKLHAESGGIIPENAARQQVASIIPVIDRSLSDAFGQDWKKSKNKTGGVARPLNEFVDAIAVTVGPGLIGSLLVGIETAKTLSYLHNMPIVPVNHLVGHIYANWLKGTNETKPSTQMKHDLSSPEFPAVALVVSGGHTDLVYMKDHDSIDLVGTTRDDAAGEAFDKTARLLGLPYPGGSKIENEAKKYLKNNPGASLNMFPRPLIDSDGFDFSFSGLKTSVLRKTNKLINAKKKFPNNYVEQLSAEIQESIVDVLVVKTTKAVEKYNPKSLLISGGVAANKRLIEKLSGRIKSEILQDFHVPPGRLCTDNAAYIAACAFYNYHPIKIDQIVPYPQMRIVGSPWKIKN